MNNFELQWKKVTGLLGWLKPKTLQYRYQTQEISQGEQRMVWSEWYDVPSEQ